MKSQLLEDIGDSLPPPRIRSSAPPPPQPAPDPAARPRVWRSRQAAAPPQPAPPPEPAPPLESPTEPHFFEPPPVIGSYSSQQPDLGIHLTDEPAPWMDRWGRKFFGWTVAAVLVTAVAGTGWWLYGDRQVESTLALVADQTPPAPPLPAAPVAAPPAVVPPAAPVAEATPDTRELPAAEPAPEAPVPAEPVEQTPPDVSTVAAAAAAAPLVAAAPEPKKKAPPVAHRQAGKRTPARSAVRRAPPPARVAAKPAPPRPEPEPAGNALAETLRQCRAAGYHATLCIKRGCTATRFGLVCRK